MGIIVFEKEDFLSETGSAKEKRAFACLLYELSACPCFEKMKERLERIQTKRDKVKDSPGMKNEAAPIDADKVLDSLEKEWELFQQGYCNTDIKESDINNRLRIKLNTLIKDNTDPDDAAHWQPSEDDIYSFFCYQLKKKAEEIISSRRP